MLYELLGLILSLIFIKQVSFFRKSYMEEHIRLG